MPRAFVVWRPQRWSWRSSEKGRSPRPSARRGALRSPADAHCLGRCSHSVGLSLPQLPQAPGEALVRVAHDAGSMDNITVMVVAF